MKRHKIQAFFKGIVSLNPLRYQLHTSTSQNWIRSKFYMWTSGVDVLELGVLVWKSVEI